MGVPQIILIVLFAASLAVETVDWADHRKPGKSLVFSLIDRALLTSILAWGGFWK